MARTYQAIQTKLVHSGEPESRFEGAVSMPIFQSATFENQGTEKYHELKYIRLNNTPNHRVLHRKLADIEGGEAALVTSSGMAAITSTLLTFLKTGDHLLAQEGLYGGSHDFIQDDLADFGIEFDFIPLDDPVAWEKALKPNSRALFVESITNPLIQVGDLEGLANFALKHQLVSVIDNTFASPINFRPLESGFQLVMHSATKYLNGHSDIVAGAVIGSRRQIRQITDRVNHLGGSLDPHACFLLQRGLKTLALRIGYQNRSALKIARFLEQHPQVACINYPGLESNPSHVQATKLFSGFGGMLSFELTGGAQAANRFIEAVRLPIVAPSLGGVETLITLPCKTSHAGMSPDQRRALGIGDGLIRLSVGIESSEELMDDLARALEQ